MEYDTRNYKYWQQFEENHIITNVEKLLLNSDVTVTDKIINLQNLHILRLYGKDITVFPEAFFQHPRINYIKIENTSITSLPEEIWNMTNLQTVILENNKSLEILPEIRQNNRVLTNLLINTGNFRTLPNSIDNLENLNSLVCVDISLEKLPDSIVKFRHLDTLVLDNNKLEFLPEKIGNLTTLTAFSANFNKLSFLPQSFYKLVNLRVLYISENPFNGPIKYNSFYNLDYKSRDELRVLNEKIRQSATIRGDETAIALLDSRQKSKHYKASSAIIPRARYSQISNADIQKLVKNPKFYELPEDLVERILRDYLGYMPKPTSRFYRNILSNAEENTRNSSSNKTAKTLLLKGGRRRRRKTRKGITRRGITRRRNRK